MRKFKGSWLGGLSLLLMGLVTLVPGLWSIPVIDRDEARFAQASRQMFEAAAWPAHRLDLRRKDDGAPKGFHSGGWSIPMVQDRPRLNKPPLIYWLQVASAWAFTGGDPTRDAIWMYRVPGAVCALLSVLLTWRLGLRLFDPLAAWLGAAFLAVCPLIAFDAHQARADQLLLTTVLGALLCLWNVWRAARTLPAPRSGSLWAIGLWLSLALSIMAKGPIGPLVFVLTALTLSLWDGHWRWLARTRPLVGLVIIAAAVGPWLWAVGSRIGWQTYAHLALDETLGRAAGSKEGHWGPPGFHTLLAVVLFWPGCLLTAASIARAWRLGAPRRERLPGRNPVWCWLSGLLVRDAGRPAEFFLIAWLVPGWLFFELFGAKLAHYPMPMYPALALLTARGVVAAETGGLGELTAAAVRFGLWIWRGIGVVLGSALAVTTVILAPQSDVFDAGMIEPMISLVGGLAVIALSVQAARRAGRGNWAGATRLSLAAGATFIACFMLYPARQIVPTTGVLIEQAASMIDQEAGPGPRFWASNVVRDSAVFQTRGGIVQVPLQGAVEWLRAAPRRVYIQEIAKSETAGELTMTPEPHQDSAPRMLYRAQVHAVTGARALLYFIRPSNPPAVPGGS